MLVDEDSKEYLTRVPVQASPMVFQRTMEGLLQGIPHTGVLLDNILLSGPTNEDNMDNLEMVFRRLSEAGVKLKAKCQLMKPTLVCLGHQVDKNGFQPVEAKVEAIKDAPETTNATELKSFLEMINFYGKFFPNLLSTLERLHRLLRKERQWQWGEEQKDAFQAAKDLLSSSHLLVHYDPKKELVVSGDASPYGVGAVLAHIMADGSEKPIAYASRTLTEADRGYSKLDKEALAMPFAMKKFHQFLYGRHFKVYKDHKRFLGLLSPHKATPTMESSHMQRWALTSLVYEYELLYRPEEENSNADALSRLPLPEAPEATPVPGDVIHLMENLYRMP